MLEGLSLPTYADIDFPKAISLLGQFGIPYALIVPTQTGLGKSIMDATEQVRSFLKIEGIHDYSKQHQGPARKIVLKGFLAASDCIQETTISLYRPFTKQGDPRIWFSGLRSFAKPNNVLALFFDGSSIFVVNLSDRASQISLKDRGSLFQLLSGFRNHYLEAKNELLRKLLEIGNMGWIKATGSGDFAVGDTLEHLLGIKRNCSEEPDYKGIELKASRISVDGRSRTGKNTLFSRTVDGGLTYREIIEKYGRVYEMPTGKRYKRLYDTIRAGSLDSFGLQLFANDKLERIELLHVHDSVNEYVSSWSYENLRKAAGLKHKQTFFVTAQSKTSDGQEFFRYVSATYTSKPNLTQLPALIGSGVITVDIVGRISLDDGKYRDHGMLWRIKRKDLHLFVSSSESYSLT